VHHPCRYGFKQLGGCPSINGNFRGIIAQHVRQGRRVQLQKPPINLKAATTYHKGGVCAQFGIIEAGNLCRNGIHGLPRVQLLRVWVHLKRNFYWESTICVAIRDGVFSRPEICKTRFINVLGKESGHEYSGARRVVACLECELCS
jgi:hypothetical protein